MFQLISSTTDTSCLDFGRERLSDLGTNISMSLEADLLFYFLELDDDGHELFLWNGWPTKGI